MFQIAEMNKMKEIDTGSTCCTSLYPYNARIIPHAHASPR